jgi:hypothetical protein
MYPYRRASAASVDLEALKLAEDQKGVSCRDFLTSSPRATTDSTCPVASVLRDGEGGGGTHGYAAARKLGR